MEKMLQKMLATLFAIVLPCLPMMVQSQDFPNPKKERQLFDRFRQSAARPTDPILWNRVMTQSRAQKYTVMRGDTLSEISDTLFGDKNFWPKIWALNSQIISNPHWIEPGMEIHFIPGTSTNPPGVGVGADLAEEVLALTWDASLPPERPDRVPLMKQLPASLPNWGFAPFTNRTPVLRLETPPIAVTKDQSLTFFVSPNSISGVGMILGTEAAGVSGIGSDSMLVELREGVEPGRRFTVLRELEEIRDPRSRRVARLIQVQGEIEIVEVVSSAKRYYRARIVRQVLPVETGSQLVAEAFPTFQTTPIEFESISEGNDRKAWLFAGGFRGDREILSGSSLVFLSLAEGESSLQVGDNLPVYHIPGERSGAEWVRSSPRKVGALQVVRVEPPFATAVVMHQLEPFQPGDASFRGSLQETRSWWSRLFGD